MSRSFRFRQLSLDDISTETFSTETSKEKASDDKSTEINKSEEVRNFGRSNSNSGSYIVNYGPIRVRHRRSSSQTLATGRRSKDEPVYGDEAAKRELRRTKNRMAARRLKQARDNIEFELLQKIQELEHEEDYLQEQHKKLEERKAQLTRAVYNAQQAPLIPLVADLNIPILFEPHERSDLLIDLQPLLKILDDQISVSDK